jgi:hypothetical protein
MPQLEPGLYAYLKNDPAVSALVGDRIFPNVVPEGTILPSIRYQRITTQREDTHDPFGEMHAYVRATVQIDSWSTSAQGAMEVGEAVMLALSGFHGDMEGVSIGRVTNVRESDTYDLQKKLHGRSQDFQFWYMDAITVAS